MTQGDFEVEPITGDDLATEPSLLDPAEERELPREVGIGENGNSPQLGQRFDHQNPWQGRPPGEVPSEEVLVASQLPAAGGRLTGFDGHHLCHEQEGVTVGKVILGSHA